MDSEKAYLCANDNLLAIRLRDGMIQWQNRTNGSVRSVLVTADKVVYSANGGIQAVNKNNGQLVWRKTDLATLSTIIAVGNSIYLLGSLKDNHGERATLIALNQSNGEMRWTLPLASDGQLIYQSGRFFLDGQTGIVVVADSAAVKNP